MYIYASAQYNVYNTQCSIEFYPERIRILDVSAPIPSQIADQCTQNA